MMRTLAAATIVAGLAVSPAAAQNREHQQMAAELRIVQEQMQLLALELQKTVAQLDAAVQKIESRLDAAEEHTRKLFADQKLSLDQVSTDIRIVRERTQEANTRIGTLTEEVEALRTSVASLSTLALQQSTPIDPTAPGDPSAVPPPQPTPSRAGVSPSRLFQTAFADYTGGQLSLAISGFQTFLSTFPDSPQADDAKYYIGYSYLLMKRYPEALKTYTELIQTYPNGDKVPEAWMDIGTVHRVMGRTEEARAAWETVVSKYPESNQALIARQRLDGLPPAPETAKP